MIKLLVIIDRSLPFLTLAQSYTHPNIPTNIHVYKHKHSHTHTIMYCIPAHTCTH